MGIWRHYDTDETRPEATETEITATQNTDEEDDPEDWRFAIVLDGHESEVKSVAWSTGGNLLATCSRDKSVWIWEEVGEDDYETVAVLQEHEGDVKCVAWHPEEELVASASYDDDVRLWREDVDDWGCVGVLRGHGSTVWYVAWESMQPRVMGDIAGQESVRKGWMERREAAGPRLLSCSDDRTIRVWRRNPKERVQQSRLSIIKSGSSEEEWVEEAQLPQVHSRPIYAVAWSKSGRIVSTGGDGTIAVYEEQWQDTDKQPARETTTEAADGEDAPGKTDTTTSEPMTGVQVAEEHSSTTDGQEGKQPTRWTVIAQFEAAHGVFEVNHVAWARKPAGKAVAPAPEEEFIITTGDDGSVKVWEMNS